MNTIERPILAPQYTISPVIKGSWQLSRGHSPAHSPHALADMEAFRQAGITTFDFGDIYLGVEELIGEYIRQLREKIGKAADNTIQLHTKYVPDSDNLQNHSYEQAKKIIDRSRERLGVDTLDLVQFHWWNYDIPKYIEAMRDLVKLQAQGAIRHIGVTNFDVPRMEEFVEAGVKPASIQLQYSLLDRRPENGMTDFCAANNIKILCYGTVAGGFLSEKYVGAPEPQLPFKNRSLVKYKLIIEEFGGWAEFQKLLALLNTIAKKRGLALSSVASAYILQKPAVSAVIIGARDASHLSENLKVAAKPLQKQDIDLIDTFLAGYPGPSGDVYDLERSSPIHSSIMYTTNNKHP